MAVIDRESEADAAPATREASEAAPPRRDIGEGGARRIDERCQVASPDQAVLAARSILARLQRAFSTLRPEDLEDATSAALADWCRISDRVILGKLETFLYHAAWRNARDISRTHQARMRREHEWCAYRYAGPDVGLEREPVLVRDLIQSIHDLLPDERLRAVFRLRATGERRTSRYAEALGVGGASAAEARKLVKREKDRLEKHLQRCPRIRALARTVSDDD